MMWETGLSLAVALPIAFALGLGLAVAVWAVHRSLVLGVALALVFFLVDAATVGISGLRFGRNIQAFDILAILFFLAGSIRQLARPEMSQPKAWLLAYFALMVVPLSTGFAAHGIGAAPDFRWFFQYLAFAYYAMSFPPDQPTFRAISKAWLIGAGLLAGLVLFRWSADALGSSLGASWRHVGAGRPFRVVSAAQALYLAMAAMLLLYHPARAGGFVARQRYLLASFFLLLVVGLQHRSAWIATVAGFLAIFALDKHHRPYLQRLFATFLGVGLLIAVPLSLLGLFDKPFEVLWEAIVDPMQYRSTFSDRYVGWYVLLTDWWNSSNAFQYLFGQPFGAGYARRLVEFGSGYVVEYTPHNYYVQAILRTGLIGVALLVSTLAVTLGMLLSRVRSASDAHAPDQTIRRVLFVLVLMQAVFFGAYGGRFEHGLILGLALAWASGPSAAGLRRRPAGADGTTEFGSLQAIGRTR